MFGILQECLGHKDSKNHCYLRKRALYLTYIATQLQKSSDIDDLQFLYHHGNYMKPILMASVKGKARFPGADPGFLDRGFKFTKGGGGGSIC